MRGFDYIDRLCERIRESSRIADADKDALIAFSEEMEVLDTRYSNSRHIKLLQYCIVLTGDSQKYAPDELPDVRLVDTFEDEDVVRAVIRWIKRNFDNEETKRDYRVAVRMFGEHRLWGKRFLNRSSGSLRELLETTTRSPTPPRCSGGTSTSSR